MKQIRLVLFKPLRSLSDKSVLVKKMLPAGIGHLIGMYVETSGGNCGLAVLRSVFSVRCRDGVEFAASLR